MNEKVAPVYQSFDQWWEALDWPNKRLAAFACTAYHAGYAQAEADAQAKE